MIFKCSRHAAHTEKFPKISQYFLEDYYTAKVLKEDLIKLFITCILVFASSLFFTRLGEYEILSIRQYL